jgi:hypothetical protein
MPVEDLLDWLEENARPGRIWFVKRLSGNDTQATGSHQAGPYIPKEFLLGVFPELNRPEAENPRVVFDVCVDSHSDMRQVQAIWYNNRVRRTGTRNEMRVTGWGGAGSALIDPDSTGAVLSFPVSGFDAPCRVWVANDPPEEDIIENRLGRPVEPGIPIIWKADEPESLDIFTRPKRPSRCSLAPSAIPAEWLDEFPTGAEVVAKAIEMRPDTELDMDRRLLTRRACEYDIFRSLEEAVAMPTVQSGFSTLADFLSLAQTVLQGRKSRSGRSLELHAREIFLEENLEQGVDFDWQPRIPSESPPDFLFPSLNLYSDTAFPVSRLRLLAVKTTCKDRWRQVVKEARRLDGHDRHLLTLQEGVSESQFAEMTGDQVRLVVPKGLHESYPSSVRPHLISFESFIGDVRLLRTGI